MCDMQAAQAYTAASHNLARLCTAAEVSRCSLGCSCWRSARAQLHQQVSTKNDMTGNTLKVLKGANEGLSATIVSALSPVIVQTV